LERRNSCADKERYAPVLRNAENNSDSDCTVTYSDSKKQVIDLNEKCLRAIVVNSGSGTLTIRSVKTLELLTVINNGSNNANLSGIRAKRVILNDRGSGILQLSSLEEITGSSNGSGTIIISGPGKNRVENKGSGDVIGPND
jgi:hypothetical protein